MLYLRSLLFVMLFWGAVAVYSSWIMLLPRRAARARFAGIARRWSRTVLWLLDRICHLRYEVEGLEHLPHGHAVLLCNHQSTWETVALRGLLPDCQSWVLKRELLSVPFFGWALRRFQPIAIDRQAGRQALRRLLEEGVARLKQGDVVVVFPEGTRVAPGVMHRFNVGGSMLACRAMVPVVPVAHNAGVFWARGRLLKLPGCIRLRIGAPILPDGRTAQEINAAADDWIRGTLAQLPHSA